MAETEMVERVARAIKAKVPVGYGMTEDEALEYARATIETMREPTDAMGLGLPKGYRAGSHSATQIWQAMIDAALSPPSKD